MEARPLLPSLLSPTLTHIPKPNFPTQTTNQSTVMSSTTNNNAETAGAKVGGGLKGVFGVSRSALSCLSSSVLLRSPTLMLSLHVLGHQRHRRNHPRRNQLCCGWSWGCVSLSPRVQLASLNRAHHLLVPPPLAHSHSLTSPLLPAFYQRRRP